MRELTNEQIRRVNGGVAPIVVGIGIGAVSGAISGYQSGGASGAFRGAALGAASGVAGGLAAATAGFSRLAWAIRSAMLATASGASTGN